MNPVLEALDSQGDSEAMLCGRTSSSYRELTARRADWVQRLRREGVGAGRVVALRADFGVESVAALLALCQLKAITVPLSSVPRRTMQEFLGISGAEFLIELPGSGATGGITVIGTGAGSGADNVLYNTLRRAGNAGLVLFSSGTTGQSKASVLDLDRLAGGHLGRRRKPRRTMAFLSFDHIGGLNTLLHSLAHGGTVITTPARTPDRVLRVVQEARVQVLPTTPTFLTMCLIGDKIKDYDLSGLEVITYGTEPMPEHTLRTLHRQLPGVRLKQTYGLSELGIMPTRSKSDDSAWVKLGGEGFEYKIVDGILWVKSDKAMLGYLNAPYSFDPDGFFNTQDQVESDGEYVRILGRRSEIINVAGLKVYPNEVESTILEIPGVAEVTVSARPNPVTGHVVHARVKPEPGHSPTVLGELVRAHCRARLAEYKVPVFVELSEAEHHSARFKKTRA